MSNDVTIPRETARAIAAWLRSDGGDAPSPTVDAWADALDPRPSLRYAVAGALRDSANRYVDDITDDEAYALIADAALAVVRDYIATMPGLLPAGYRGRVLALFDGAES